MKLNFYINYLGKCEEAFRFYEQQLGGKIIMMMRHGDNPTPGGLSEEHNNEILHAQLELGGAVLMGADVPHAEPMRSAYLSLDFTDEAEAERIYKLLTDGGEIFMKMEKTFFANRFAMFRDRFGTSWMLTQR